MYKSNKELIDEAVQAQENYNNTLLLSDCDDRDCLGQANIMYHVLSEMIQRLKDVERYY